MLALLLAMGGAWAQGPTQVTEFTTDLIASWQTDDSPVTLADLQALGFEAVDESVAHAWTGAPTSGYAYLIYGFNEGSGSLMDMMFYDGNVGEPNQGIISKGGFYDMIEYGVKWFYTGSPAIELTKAGANQWTLGQAPDYDLELQVEYYEAHALKDIPAGWTVMVNGVPQQTPYQGDSLMITETDSVTLIPAGNPRRVKSVTLEEVVAAPQLQTVHVGNMADATFYYLPGETWEDAIARPENTGFGKQGSWVTYNGMMVTYQGSAFSPNTQVDPNAEYEAIM